MSQYGRGYIKDTPAKRARAKSSRLLLGGLPEFPTTCDNRDKERVQLDQGPLGSCTGHGTAHRLQVAGAVQGVQWLIDNVVSPAEVYTVTRCLERVPNADGSLPALTDSGAMPADLVVALMMWGVVPFAGGAPTDCTPDNVNNEPSLEMLEGSAQKLIIGEYRIDEQAPDAIQQTYAAIASQGAVGLGIFVDSAFENWTADQPPLDTVDLNDPNGGGHWLCAVAYDSTERKLCLWNSWGAGWGDNGHIWVSANWFAQAVSDVYADKLRLVGG